MAAGASFNMVMGLDGCLPVAVARPSPPRTGWSRISVVAAEGGNAERHHVEGAEGRAGRVPAMVRASCGRSAERGRIWLGCQDVETASTQPHRRLSPAAVDG